MNQVLDQYRKELEEELVNILSFWQDHTPDYESGGFYGRINNAGETFKDSPKGAVLNSRILWAFSAAYNLTKNEDYLRTATRAFHYISSHFIDKEFGGVYWTVDSQGNPLDAKKQIYALSFAIYGLSEFYIASKVEEAKLAAIDLYKTIVRYSYDYKSGGYIEALSRNWEELEDLRLSNKDANEKKSMNTHLHVLEGFANLYRIWPDEKLNERITELIYIFERHIIDPETHHLILFFDEEWNKKAAAISYGHDIEAAWLIQETAEILGNPELINEIKKESLLIADAATEGLDSDGGLWYEFDKKNDQLIKEKHWWPQAEAMVGFFNAWQISGDEIYLNRSLKSWNFIQKHIIDKKNGEWYWGITEDHSIMEEDKVGVWKCPYHNVRACVELIKRISEIEQKTNNF
jgi:cellobiose epimerase